MHLQIDKWLSEWTNGWIDEWTDGGWDRILHNSSYHLFFQAVYNPGGTKFCFFDSLTGSVIPFLTDEQSNANLPIGLQFDGLDLFFEINNEYNFDGLVSEITFSSVIYSSNPLNHSSISYFNLFICLSIHPFFFCYLYASISCIHYVTLQVGYSMAYVSQNRSILRMPNTTVPLQGTFKEDLCKTITTD